MNLKCFQTQELGHEKWTSSSLIITINSDQVYFESSLHFMDAVLR